MCSYMYLTLLGGFLNSGKFVKILQINAMEVIMSKKSNKQPNILFIMADQLAGPALPLNDESFAKARNRFITTGIGYFIHSLICHL